MKIKYSKEVCAHDKVFVALNVEKNNYLNNETSTIGNTIGNVCMRCHDSESLNFFGLSKQSNKKFLKKQIINNWGQKIP